MNTRSVAGTPVSGHRRALETLLTDDQLGAIDALDTGRRGGPEPTAITLEAFGRPVPEA